GQLRDLITSIEGNGQANLPNFFPHIHLALLQSIVEAAAHIFKAAGSAIALITDDGQELEFRVSYNVIGRGVTGMRFPINRGIAGYVAITGQALAVSSVEQDARFNRTLAEEIGYIPSSILAVPLMCGENLIGVIEILDKLNGETFNLKDIELLALFARQAASAIEQAQNLEQVQSALISGLKGLVGDHSTSSPENGSALGSAPGSDLLRLAEMLKDVSALSGPEQEACLQVLHIFQAYSRAKPALRFGAGRFNR
ncbi:MAG TPA: GAF domain-containing protein, partial [Anaerolineales bacterium]|nr:GAF domain-containing protein [Anaerolineales bacterium]